MLRSRGVQTLVNGAIIVVIIVLLIAAPLVVIKPKSAGVLIGKMASADGLISGVLSGMDPEKVAALLNGGMDEVAEFGSKMIGEIDPELLANAVNENEEWIGQLLADLDGAALAEGVGPLIGGSLDFVNEIVQYIDVDVIADVVNDNADFLIDFIGEIDPTMITPMLGIQNLPEFANKLLPLIDASVIAGVINGNEAWITQLIGSLNPDALVSIMTPETMASVASVIPYVDAGVIAGLVNQVGPSASGFATEVVGKLDPAALASIVAAVPPDTIIDLMNAMDPSMISAILNGSSTMALVKDVAVGISPDLINTVAANQALVSKVLAIVDPAAIGALVGQVGGFAVTLMNGLDPNIIAGLVEGNVDLILNMAHSIDFSIVNTMLENDQIIANVISLVTRGLDFVDMGLFAGALTDIDTLVNGLIAGLDPSVIAGMVNGNVDWIQQLATALSPAVLADTVGSMSPFLTNLLGKIDPTAFGPIISSVDPTMLVDIVNMMLPQINTSVLANAVNANVPFLAGVVKSLNTTVLANAINANPELISKLLPQLHMDVLAEAVNEAGPVVNDLMGRLDPQVIAIIVNSLLGSALDNAPAFVAGLLDGVDIDMINYALSNNQPFIEGVLANMDLSPEMMSGMDPDILASLVERFLGTSGIDPFMIADLVNNPAVADFIGQMAGMLDPQILANAVNSNAPFITDIMRYIDVSGVMAVANVSSSYIVDIADNLLPLLDAAALGQAISNVNPAAMEDLIDGILAAPGPGGGIDLDPIFDLIENPAIADFAEELLANLDAAGISPLLSNTGNLVSNMLTWNEGSGPGVDPAVLVEAINGPNAPGGPVSEGINPRTGEAWKAEDNILKRVWIGAGGMIAIPGWDVLGISLPNIYLYMKITGAAVSPAPFELADPW